MLIRCVLSSFERESFSEYELKRSVKQPRSNMFNVTQPNTFHKDFICSVIGYLNHGEQSEVSTVCVLWYDITKKSFNKYFEETLIKVHSSLAQLLQKTPSLIFPFEHNTRFIPLQNPSREINISTLIDNHIKKEIKLFDSGKGITNVMKELVDSYKVGTLSIHIWKAWPPYTFTIITLIFITMTQEIDCDNCPISASMSFIKPKEVKLLTGQEAYPSAPAKQDKLTCMVSSTDRIENYSLKVLTYFWGSNLDDTSSGTITSNLNVGHYLGMKHIDVSKICS